MTRPEATALWMRLCDGTSWFNERGEERMVDPEKACPREPSSVPTVDELMERFSSVDPSLAPTGWLERMAAQKAAQDAVREKNAAAERATVQNAMAGMMARLRTRTERRVSLPCYELDPMAHPDKGGSDLEATTACEASRAFRSCDWSRDPLTCPRMRLGANHEATAARLRDAGVPMVLAERLLAATPGGRLDGRVIAPVRLESRPALMVAEAWLAGGGVEVPPYAPFADRRPLLVLAGKNGGEGKSLAAGWFLAQLPGRWISCAELAQIQASKYERSDLTEPQTLVIDDAGTEPLTEWIRGRIYDVVSDRIGNGRRTVITTNIADRAVFASRYDDRLERRIAESGRWINLGKWTGGAHVPA